jgi:prepilin-type N-terminal cleavage/methylation domain-containing protein
MRKANSQPGFTLLELLVAASIGLTVILVMSSLFKVGMDAAFTVTERAETQQNMRAAIEMMTKDISLAGAGLPSGGLQLVSGGTVSLIGCNAQTGQCYLPNGTYPNSGAGVPNYMYGIIPGFNTGVEGGQVIAAAPGQINSRITSIYCDDNFPLTNFSFTFPGGNPPANVAVINNAVQPNNILAPGGLNVGDLLLFQVSAPGNTTAGGNDNNAGNSLVETAAAVGEITSIPNGNQVGFAANDTLNLNQSGAGIGNNLAFVAAQAAIPGALPPAVCRLNAVSYFIEVPPAGGTVQTPRLMRQVNGLPAVPVADNIINLQFTYDVIDAVAGTVVANQRDPIGAGENPGLIQKVNIWIMGQSLTPDGKKSKSMYLATSVSARNMSFCNSYSSNSTQCQ